MLWPAALSRPVRPAADLQSKFTHHTTPHRTVPHRQASQSNTLHLETHLCVCQPADPRARTHRRTDARTHAHRCLLGLAAPHSTSPRTRGTSLNEYTPVQLRILTGLKMRGKGLKMRGKRGKSMRKKEQEQGKAFTGSVAVPSKSCLFLDMSASDRQPSRQGSRGTSTTSTDTQHPFEQNAARTHVRPACANNRALH